MKKFGAWVKDTVLRSVKTSAQSAVALVTANTIGVTHVDWQHVGDVAGLAFVVCVLHNLATLQLTGDTATVTTPAPIIVSTITPAQPAPVSDLDDPADVDDDDTPDDTDSVPPAQPAAPAAPAQ